MPNAVMTVRPPKTDALLTRLSASENSQKLKQASENYQPQEQLLFHCLTTTFFNEE